MKYSKIAVLLLLAAMVMSYAGCSKKQDSPAVLKRQGWVSDYAAILSPQENARISATLELYEKETCHQVFLLIVPSLAGEHIAEFSQRTASAWKIGQPGFDNGFLVSIAMEEGLRFAIREGGRTVGAGVVTKIIE